jgi:hypothetical protein
MREGKLSIREEVAQCKGVGDMLFSGQRNVPAPPPWVPAVEPERVLHRQISLD